MPLFAIIARDKANGVADRLAHRPEHLEHLRGLGDRLVFAGALFGADEQPEGSLVVLEAESLAAARAIAALDPFVKRGVFASYDVRRWTWSVNNPTGRGQ